MGDEQASQCFENLVCYQQALILLKAAYRLAENLPKYECYNLADQIRRASQSAVLNIAEGYGRYHYLEKLHFFYIARGSLCETLSAFIGAHQVGYIDDQQFAWARSIESEAEKALNGYISFIRKQRLGSEEFGNRLVREESPDYWVIDAVPDEQS
jgi:four helix bundle protein